MASTQSQLRKRIIDIGRLMYQKGWIAANDGNITVRLDPERIVATPTGTSKGMMAEEDLIVCDMRGKKLEGTREPTTELLMHLAVYELRPDVQAVVHAHPPVSTGFAAAGRALDRAVLPEVVIYLGSIPLARYGLPGTPELTEALAPLIPGHDALLMSNHGVVTYGSDLDRAFFNMEVVEHFARITLVAEMLGGPRILPRKEVERLTRARSRYGVQRGTASGEPLAAEDIAGAEDKPVNGSRPASAIEDILGGQS